MAWTAPRTWVTGETVTAALFNTHVRDNLLQTATAKVTTAGDITYATAATALARLGVGTNAQFLRGGASAPEWSSTLGGGANSGLILLPGAAPTIRWNDTDAADNADFWTIHGDGETLRLSRWDDSASATVDSMQLAQGDFVLHTGLVGQAEGAVIIGADAAATGNLTTSGTKTCDVTAVATGGPAWVLGHWFLNISVQTGATPTGHITILPRDDGVNINAGGMSLSEYQLSRVGLAADENWTIQGSWYVRHTSADTSDYELFSVAETNSEWQVDGGFMTVQSFQYPT